MIMYYTRFFLQIMLTGILMHLCIVPIHAQFVNVGQGSYTTTFPGVDAAGRNGYPSGAPLTIGAAASKPAPTNDWWSAKIKNDHVGNLFNYPYTLKTVNQGLVATYIPWGVIDDQEPITVGVTGLNASAAKISDHSDWTVTMDWRNGTHQFEATVGIGMPFIYFEKDAADVAQVKVELGTVTVSNEMLVITDARNGADFAIYGPVGSSWTQNGQIYTSTLNGKNYWSMAFLPQGASNVTAVANEYKRYAYVFPTGTEANWQFDDNASVMRTEFEVFTEIKEGTDSTVLMGLLPHQWAHLANDSPTPDKHSYTSVRGELKTMAGNSFAVEHSFHGILPTLPYLDYYSPTFNPADLNQKVNAIKNDQLATWTDSYNEGQVMNRLIQTARIAEMMGDTAAVNAIIPTIQDRLEDWLSAESNEVAFLFYYQQPWSALLGYPAGHGQDNNINDHHFHWGYFIHAAAFMEQYKPGWANQWGPMIDLLVRDAASANRNDSQFPYLRNFSPYAGHCWANGFASFPQGNDQESTSESMQFNSALIHWGSITGNDSIRDLGIYLYTTEQAAIEEYWFDRHERIFGSNQVYGMVSRVWGNSYDNGTFWTSDIAASYGIELYPIHGGSLYLGHDSSYVDKIWKEIEQYTGILANEVNPNLWHDVMWKYLAFIDPDKAITLYDGYPDRELKFGVSDAQTYHWLHAMQVLGRVDVGLTADHPLAAAFRKGGETIYVAHNYGDSPIQVNFSDGYQLSVAAHSLATSKDIAVRGTLSASFSSAYPGGSVALTATLNGGTATKVEFLDGETLLGEVLQAPYTLQATDLSVGTHTFYARIYDGNDFNISNFVEVLVGEQLPYFGDPTAIPGVIEAGHFDFFEGGKGQGITYQDVSRGNNGDFRTGEDVDAVELVNEGATVGWISAGEWLEYTVEVQQAGEYKLDLRYASGNQAGGGPLRIESDGQVIVSGVSFAYTGDWGDWRTKTINSLPLKGGKQVLRIFFENGEFNLGRMTFTYVSPLSYDQPVADAGDNKLVLLPGSSTNLDASGSSDPGGNPINYAWTQVYGPSELSFSDPSNSQPTVSGLVEGVYLLKLEVDNGTYRDQDEMYLISSPNNNVAPKVSLLTPNEDVSFVEGESIPLAAYASDLIGNVAKVEFWAGNDLIATVNTSPYQATWTPPVGSYQLQAVAYDDDNAQGNSQLIQVSITEAPSCLGTAANGDFSYEFSDDDANPTLTFIPSQSGVGQPTCILYYGTDAGNLPGYGVTPNVPFRLNAPAGSRVIFYYTYSFPGQGEKNTADDKVTYVVGSCKSNVTNLDQPEVGLQVRAYPNPVDDWLQVDLPFGQKQMVLRTVTGSQLSNWSTEALAEKVDFSIYPSGVYLLEVRLNGKREVVKVIK